MVTLLAPLLLLLSTAGSRGTELSPFPDDAPVADLLNVVPIPHAAEEAVLSDFDLTVPGGGGNVTRRLAYRPGFAYQMERVFDFLSQDFTFVPKERVFEERFVGPHNLYARALANASADALAHSLAARHRTKRQSRLNPRTTLRSAKTLDLMVYVDEDMCAPLLHLPPSSSSRLSPPPPRGQSIFPQSAALPFPGTPCIR